MEQKIIHNCNCNEFFRFVFYPKTTGWTIGSFLIGSVVASFVNPFHTMKHEQHPLKGSRIYSPTELASASIQLSSPSLGLSYLYFEIASIKIMARRHDPLFFSKTSISSGATRHAGQSHLARQSSSYLDTPIYLNEFHQVRRRPSRHRRPIWETSIIKLESEDESYRLLTPVHPVGHSQGLKRRIQYTETPQRKRAKMTDCRSDVYAITSPTNELPHHRSGVQSYHNPRPRSRHQHFILWVAHMVLIYVVRVRSEESERPGMHVPCFFSLC